jgi:predicted nucleotidyltransferase
MSNQKYAPYDRIVTQEGIVFEVQGSVMPGSLVGRPKLFLKSMYRECLGEVYDFGQDYFKIPLTPQLYVLSNEIIRNANKAYCLPELEGLHILEYYGIPFGDIVQHFNPREYTHFRKECRNSVERNAKDLVDLLSSEGFPDNVAVSGSVMMGLSNAHSDIDLVIYGTENVSAVIDVLYKKAFVQRRTKEEFEKRYGALSEQFRSFMTFEEYLAHESSKWHRGYFKGTKLTVNVVDMTKHPSIITDRFGKLMDLSGRVIEDNRASVHPSEVLIEVDKSDALSDDYLMVRSLSRMFINQVRKGDLCQVRGHVCSGAWFVVIHEAFGGIKKESI